MSKRKPKEQKMVDEVQVNIDEVQVNIDEVNEVVVEATPSKKAGGKKILVTLSDGTQISRQEYCIKRAHEGATRSQIASELSELQGKIVPFQIVFAATAHLNDLFPKRVAKVKEVEVAAETEIEVAVEA